MRPLVSLTCLLLAAGPARSGGSLDELMGAAGAQTSPPVNPPRPSLVARAAAFEAAIATLDRGDPVTDEVAYAIRTNDYGLGGAVNGQTLVSIRIKGRSIRIGTSSVIHHNEQHSSPSQGGELGPPVYAHEIGWNWEEIDADTGGLLLREAQERLTDGSANATYDLDCGKPLALQVKLSCSWEQALPLSRYAARVCGQEVNMVNRVLSALGFKNVRAHPHIRES